MEFVYLKNRGFPHELCGSFCLCSLPICDTFNASDAKCVHVARKPSSQPSRIREARPARISGEARKLAKHNACEACKLCIHLPIRPSHRITHALSTIQIDTQNKTSKPEKEETKTPTTGRERKVRTWLAQLGAAPPHRRHVQRRGIALLRLLLVQPHLPSQDAENTSPLPFEK